MIVVFTGPTLAPEEARPLLDAIYLPPVAQGDVLRAARDRPWAIGIIDGYFERVPAVWHKEILWALSEGIHVYGAASMGALRAAELETFGMVGVGEIFAAYRDGEIEDDDEVAVVHAGESEGFRALSEAMVDIRATLERAAAERVVGPAAGRRIEEAAKSLYYPDRTYAAILERAAAGVDQEELTRLRRWLPAGRVRRKRQDALELLRVLAERFAARPEPKRVSFTFHRTEIWEHAVRRGGRRGLDAAAGGGPSELLLDELRLLGRRVYRDRRAGALLRALALAEFKRYGGGLPEEGVRRRVEDFRRRRDLDSPEAARAWVADRELDEDGFGRWMEDEARLDVVRLMFGRQADDQLEAELRLHDLLPALGERLREKRHLLDGEGLAVPGLEATGLGEDELLRWYFEERLGEEVPGDLERYAADLDLPGTDLLFEMLVREYLFVHRPREGDAGDR